MKQFPYLSWQIGGSGKASMPGKFFENLEMSSFDFEWRYAIYILKIFNVFYLY